MKRGRQSYQCLVCKKQFSQKRKTTPVWVKKAYTRYSVNKQTLAELSVEFKKSIPTLRKYFETYTAHTGEVCEVASNLNIVFDATFFGRTYGILVFRANGKNIFWKEISSESCKEVAAGLTTLDGITQKQYASFTIDGRKGILKLLQDRYGNVPIQLCHFHQQQIMKRYLTSRPKSPCGRHLKALVSTLTTTDEEVFTKHFLHFQETFKEFLKEKNEQGKYQHKRLRSAVRSLEQNMLYLFTYQRFPSLNIPNTTNSCDGSFAHWKQKIQIHRGLKKHRRKKMLDTLLSL